MTREATSGYAVRELRPVLTDPQRPAAPIEPAPGRADAAALADRATQTLLALTGDEQLVKDIRRALIRAGVVQVRREDGES